VVGVLVALAFAGWRMLASLRALSASVANLNRQLTPALEELARQSQLAAERAAKLQARFGPPAQPSDGDQTRRTDAAG
jgi:hypothetical protein